MTDLLRTVAAYVPPSLVRAVLTQATPTSPAEARTERFLGAVLFADISGFTPLTEALAQKGSEGPEELTRLLNRYFSWMIAFAEAEGGEVVKFGGDALTVVFPALDEPLGHASRRALQTAETMQTAMEEFGIMESSVGLVTLKMKIGIGAGEITTAHVGGFNDRWEYLIAGEPIRQASQAEQEAHQDQIRLSPEADLIISPTALTRQPLPKPAWDKIENPAAVETALRCYIPRPVQTWLDKELHEWLATLRPMSVLFMGIHGLDYTQPNAIPRLHQFVSNLQQIVHHYQGSLPRLTIDDKGTVLLILFGAPPYSHEDDPERALRCALAAQALASQYELSLAIGVTTGRVFAGPVGGPTRREYTVMGDTVNLAARLMSAAGPGQLYCNYDTYRSASGRMRFEPLPPVRVKGKAGLIRRYRPTGEANPLEQLHQIHLAAQQETIIGRQAEVARLQASLDQLEAGHSQLLLIEGEAGIGKSQLIKALVQLTQARQVTLLLGQGHSIEQDRPYRVWQDILTAFFELEQPGPSTSEAETGHWQQLQNELQERIPELADYFPLLNDVLGLDWPEPERLKALTISERHEALSTLLLALLAHEAQKKPLLLILEDAQWLDSASWKLVTAIAQTFFDSGPPRLLVVTMRPMLESRLAASGVQRLAAMGVTERLRLDTLSPDETLRVAGLRLGLTGNELPEGVAELIRRRAGGNPFFAEELLFNLLDNGFITLKSLQNKTRCLLSRELDTAAQTLPATIQNVILSQIDQLPPEKQLVLKVGAVIGQAFAYTTLRDTLQEQMEINEEMLKGYLNDLTYLDLIRPDSQAPNLTYTFRYTIIREVTYQSLLFDRRRQLHRSVANWYENSYNLQANTHLFKLERDAAYFSLNQVLPPNPGASLQPDYALLVYHWHQAEDEDQERRCATLLAQQAIAQFANAEAVGYLNRALDLTPENDLESRYELLLARQTVFDRRGEREAQAQDLKALAELVKKMKNDRRGMVISLQQAHYDEATGHYRAALIASQQAVAQAKLAQEPWGESQAYLLWSKIALRQSNFPAARDMVERAQSLIRATPNPYDEARAFSLLATLNWLEGDYDQAQRHCQQAIQFYPAEPDSASRAYTFNISGLVHLYLGKLAAAREDFEQALYICHATGSRRNEPPPFGNIGIIYRREGHYLTARDYFEQALETSQAIQDRAGEADMLNQLGVTYFRLGDYNIARSYLGQALNIYRETGCPLEEANVLSNLAATYHSLEDYQTTKRYCELALTSQQQLGHLAGELTSLTYLGHALAGLDQWDEASQSYHRAQKIHLELELTSPPLEILTGLAEVSLAQNKAEQGLAYLETVLNGVESEPAAGLEGKLWIYLKIYLGLRTLKASHPHLQEQATSVLETAYTLLQTHVARLDKPALRQKFIENNKTHQKIVASWEGREISIHQSDPKKGTKETVDQE